MTTIAQTEQTQLSSARYTLICITALDSTAEPIGCLESAIQSFAGESLAGLMVPGWTGIYSLLGDRICCIRTTRNENPTPIPVEPGSWIQTTASQER